MCAGRTHDSFRRTLRVQFIARGVSVLQEKLETEGTLDVQGSICQI